MFSREFFLVCDWCGELSADGHEICWTCWNRGQDRKVFPGPQSLLVFERERCGRQGYEGGGYGKETIGWGGWRQVTKYEDPERAHFLAAVWRFEARGFSQRDACHMVGIDPNTVRSWMIRCPELFTIRLNFLQEYAHSMYHLPTWKAKVQTRNDPSGDQQSARKR